jgi:hypothetical protein
MNLATNPPAKKTMPEHASAVEASVRTSMEFAAAREELWHNLLFYEQIEERPPLLLRLLLPVPLGVEGNRSGIGDEVRCVYASGHLLKRVTQITAGESYRFDVVEQRLKIGGGIRLLRGAYLLQSLPSGGTRMSLETDYAAGWRPRRLWRPIEARVCGMFHRYILKSIQNPGPSRRTETGNKKDSL